ncbi:MAG TPA: tRNA (adenosine(37)-N6)-dimethylallyltransferase MiaA [Anaerolineales bacterium]|nr:tRNA (adenosine(37)-N6)-dimethylallyltransferase MiaA [Anaerolineales bacterium]HRF46104.1 tRNA (adenosine(37)-N6)-dimethylallyltransferase MiaA [Anaerolineales bacterium]
MSRQPFPPLVVLVGPTAVGKTALAIQLAERLNGEIVSADSRYLYRYMDIGTAKPSAAEQARVPHHLIDVTTPDQPWSLAQYQSAAFSAIGAIHARGRLPLLVGGTGQYVRAVVEGWQPPEGGQSPELRADLEARLATLGLDALVRQLRELDPESARSIDVFNPRRVVRALEVVLSTGRSFVGQRRKLPPRLAIHQFGLSLPRTLLYARIDQRVDSMLASGLVEEVRGLVARGYHWELPALSAIGYRQIGQYLRGECDLKAAADRIRRDTRVFVRRQTNWFKPDDPAIAWRDVSQVFADDLAEVVSKAVGS